MGGRDPHPWALTLLAASRWGVGQMLESKAEPGLDPPALQDDVQASYMVPPPLCQAPLSLSLSAFLLLGLCAADPGFAQALLQQVTCRGLD